MALASSPESMSPLIFRSKGFARWLSIIASLRIRFYR
jgi:hypothetical protein